MEYMSKKSLGIQEIKYGEVHCFHPLKFENDKSIEVLILNNLAEQIPKERTLINLQKYYNLTEEKAM